MPIFRRATTMPASADAVYAWHARDGAFERLSPPWQQVEVLARTGGIDEPGSRVSVSVPFGPVRTRWVAEHSGAVPGREFHDVQLSGPFARWEHHHRFIPKSPSTSVLEDEVDYRLPLGGVGAFFGGAHARRELDRLFTFRHTRTLQDLAAHARYIERKPMRILITGSSGLVGNELVPFLTTGGHDAVRLRRGPGWDPEQGVLDAKWFEGVDAVVHLAGENIAGGRWTSQRKKRIRDSRVHGTRLLSETLAGVRRTSGRPRVLVSASAIGYYGDRGDELLTEDSAPGTGFLAEVCREWESATAAAREAGIRVVNLRIGIVLSPKGGALAKMLTPFRMGVGGVIGSGEQFMSWIAVDDLAGLIHASIMDDVSGPVNAVAPQPVTNREFTKTLGRVLNRPTIVPLPAAAARLAMGEMADELLLSSARVSTRSSYDFRHPSLEPALRHLLGR